MRANWAPFVVGGVTLAVAVWAAATRREPERADRDDGGHERGGSTPATTTKPTREDTTMPSEEPGPIMRPLHGKSAVVGTVARDGKPVAARVELRQTADTDEWLGRTLVFDVGRLLGVDRSTPPVAATTAGADGRFSIEGLEPGAYEVTAVAADGAVGCSSAFVTAGARVRADPHVVGAEGTLRGRVVRPDGTPWRGPVRVVTAFPQISMLVGPVVAPSVETDDDGRFVFHGVRRGGVSVLAVERGRFAVGGPLVTAPFAGEYLVNVGAESHEVVGSVAASDGSPIAGASLVGTSNARVERTESDAEGRFRMRLASGPSVVTAEARGFTSESAAVEHAKPVAIRLTRLARVVGRVTSAADGKPVAGAVVRRFSVQENARWQSPDRDPAAARSAPDGRFVFDGVAPGRAVFVVRGGGWVSRELADRPRDGSNPLIAGAASGLETTVDLVAVPAATIAGRVLSSRGEPVEGAVVRASRRLRFDADDSGGFDPANYATGDDIAATRADGSYSIDSLIPGVEYDLVARAVGTAERTAAPVVARADDATRLDFKLPPPRWVDITVVDAGTGAGVEGASVGLSAAEDPNDSMHVLHFGSFSLMSGAQADASGRFRAGPAPEGRLIAIVFADGYEPTTGPSEVPGSGERAKGLSMTIRLTRAATIDGHVVLPDGSPASGASVTLWAAKSKDSDERSGHGVTSDATGAFHLEAPGGVVLRVVAKLNRDGEYFAEKAVRRGDRDVVLRLLRGVDPKTLVLRVTDGDRRPVPSAEAHVVYTNGGGTMPVTDGKATIDRWLAADSRVVGIEVLRAKGVDGALLPLGRVWLEQPKFGTSIDVVLPPEETITGRVVDDAGRGVGGARLRVDTVVNESNSPPFDAPWVWRLYDDWRSEVDGTFRIGSLGTGRYRIYVRPPTDFAVPDSVIVDGGARDVTFALRRATAPKITVLDGAGLAVAGAQVAVVEEDETRMPGRVSDLFSDHGPGATTAAENGVVRVEGLDPTKRYTLGVRGPKARTDLADSLFETWSPADTTVRLRQGFSIRGVVRDGDGNLVVGADVNATSSDGLVFETTSAADGVFTIVGLTAGEVRLEAVHWQSNRRSASGRATFPAGAQDVVVRLK